MVEVNSPGGNYSMTFSPGGFQVGNFEPYMQAVVAALLSDGQLPPVIVDIMWHVDLSSELFCCGPAPEGGVLHFYRDFTPIGTAYTPWLRFDYELAGVPEPSLAVPIGIAVTGLVLSRRAWTRCARRRGLRIGAPPSVVRTRKST